MSTASRAAQKYRNLVKRGISAERALTQTLRTYPARTGARGDLIYAWFQDDSFFQIFKEEPGVLTHHSSKTKAEKIILNIHANCAKCYEELWCDTNGQVEDKHCFELPGETLIICVKCQRNLVIQALVGK